MDREAVGRNTCRALAVTERLGWEGKGGMVRIGAAHHSTVEEIRSDAFRSPAASERRALDTICCGEKYLGPSHMSCCSGCLRSPEYRYLIVTSPKTTQSAGQRCPSAA
jgi:hypothetical protein